VYPLVKAFLLAHQSDAAGKKPLSKPAPAVKPRTAAKAKTTAKRPAIQAEAASTELALTGMSTRAKRAA